MIPAFFCRAKEQQYQLQKLHPYIPRSWQERRENIMLLTIIRERTTFEKHCKQYGSARYRRKTTGNTVQTTSPTGYILNASFISKRSSPSLQGEKMTKDEFRDNAKAIGKKDGKEEAGKNAPVQFRPRATGPRPPAPKAPFSMPTPVAMNIKLQTPTIVKQKQVEARQPHDGDKDE